MENNNPSNEASSRPDAPAKRIRPATIDDVPRLALVAMSGFYIAPQFAWERPYHHQYPEDTYRSYVELLGGRIADPGCLVYLAEDWYDPNEHTKTGATIATGDLYREPRPGDLVPVGLGVWNLPKDSSRRRTPEPSQISETQPTDPPADTATTPPTRDVHTAKRAQLRGKVAELKERNFPDEESAYYMSMFVVHPAYQGRGHGTILLQFGAECADEEGKAMRLGSQPKAVPLYERAGFEVLEWASVEDVDDGTRLDLAAMARRSRGGAGL